MKIKNINKVSHEIHELEKCKETIFIIEQLIQSNKSKSANCINLTYEDGNREILRLHFSTENSLINDIAETALKFYTKQLIEIEKRIEKL